MEEPDIFHAIEHSDKTLLEKLIQSGTDVNITDEFGQTLLHLAIDTAFEDAIYISDTEGRFVQPKMEIIQILLENGADHLKKDKNEKSPVEWAIERNNDVFVSDLNDLIKNKNRNL